MLKSRVPLVLAWSSTRWLALGLGSRHVAEAGVITPEPGLLDRFLTLTVYLSEYIILVRDV